MKLWKKNVLLLFVVILLTIIPLVFVKGEFSGADSQAEAVITEINKDYEPWATPLLVPASTEIESLLFALEAAIGGVIIGFGFGRLSAKRKPGDTD